MKSGTIYWKIVTGKEQLGTGFTEHMCAAQQFPTPETTADIARAKTRCLGQANVPLSTPTGKQPTVTKLQNDTTRKRHKPAKYFTHQSDTLSLLMNHSYNIRNTGVNEKISRTFFDEKFCLQNQKSIQN